MVLDYGIKISNSALSALETAGADVEFTRDRAKVLEADGFYISGAAPFTAIMDAMNSLNVNELIDKRLVAGKPVMGVGVGQQVLFEKYLEPGLELDGLGQLPGTVEFLYEFDQPINFWNQVEAAQGSKLFAGIEGESFYFTHAYGVRIWELEAIGSFIPPKVSWAQNGARFVAAMEVGPLTGTQFQPEESGAAGIKLLNNWLGTLRK